MALSPLEPRSAFLYPGMNGIETSVAVAEMVSGFAGVTRRGIKMLKQEGVKEILHRLNENGIRYALIGALACSEYAPPRATQDVDFVVLAEDVGKVRQLFPHCFLGGTAIAGIYEHEGTKFDIQPAKRRALIAVVENAISSSFSGEPVRVATLQDLIFLKLWSAGERPELGKKLQDQTDLANLLEHNSAKISAQDIASIAKNLLSMGYTAKELATCRQSIQWLNETLEQIGMAEKRCPLE